MSQLRYFLVVPAAGAGRRFAGEGPKQYAPLAGRTVIEWSLAPFASDPRCAGRVVALAQADFRWQEVAPRLAQEAGAELLRAAGGAERAHSVRNALEAISRQADPSDWVLVHDAVRPCVTREEVDRLLAAGATCADGALLAAPLADTLKRADGEDRVEATPDRARLWRAQTPQMFRYGALVDALGRALAAGRQPTDEAQALEWQGARPLLVRSSAANLKITDGADLELAEAILAARVRRLHALSGGMS